MKISQYRLLFIIIILLNISALTPLSAKVLETMKIESKILKETVEYSIYLPPDYELSNRRYPVVYLLHGYTDDETAWVQFGEVDVTADRAIRSQEIPAMIIVMPDASLSYYIDDYKGKFRYESFFIEEFVPFIDATYRTRPAKEFRGVSGLSMGGFGSLMYAMRHSDKFAACAAFSAAVRSDDEIMKLEDKHWNRAFADLYGGELSGEERINDHWKKYSPLHLAQTLDVKSLNSVRWYIDCGDDDFLYNGNSMLHILMRNRDIHHEYRVRDGVHNWTYWRTNIIEGLKFIGQSFHR